MILINKTAGNEAFIYHRFYVLGLVQEIELLINNSNVNQNFNHFSNSYINILNNHSNISKSKFNTNLDDTNKQLSHMC